MDFLLFKDKYFLICVFAMLISGIFLTVLTWKISTKKQSEQALQQAKIVAGSIEIEQFKNLNANIQDIEKKDYQKIKSQLKNIRESTKNCRFLYIMGQNEKGQVFFFVDSQPENSKDYAPPGLIYTEVPDEYLDVFNHGNTRTVGPVEDRWGILMTSLVPLKNEKGEILAILGMDIDVKDWRKTVILNALFPGTLTVMLILLTASLFIVNRNRLLLRKQYLKEKEMRSNLEKAKNEIKVLQGIFPICTQCKKIRDDQGYWQKVEAYFGEHADIKFTHSMCPDCQEELYGGQDWYENMKKDGT